MPLPVGKIMLHSIAEYYHDSFTPKEIGRQKREGEEEFLHA